MSDELPLDGPRFNESGVVNLSSSKTSGTHWVAYKKRGNRVIYYDSFGDLQPNAAIKKYFAGYDIEYNPNRYQWKSYNCGHLCLQFLRKNI